MGITITKTDAAGVTITTSNRNGTIRTEVVS